MARIRGVAIAIVLATLAPTWAWAQYASQSISSAPQGWQVRPALTVSQHYSDNVSLSVKGAERSELTTRIRPELTVEGNSARLRFTATYAQELLYRVNQETTDFSHYLRAVGNAELLARTLFVDLRAGISQQNTSLLGPQSDSNVNTTNNRTTVRTLAVSPYLRHDFGVNAVGELRYTHDLVDYAGNQSVSSNSTSDRIEAKLSSGPAYKLFVWSANASLSRIEYERPAQKVKPQSYSVSGGRLITPELRLNATVGYEDSGYPSTSDQELKGKFWSVGPEWTPSERTRIAGTYGRRYFGPSRTASISHRMRQTFIGFDYNESATTTRSNFTAPILFEDPVRIVAFCQVPGNRPSGVSEAQCVSGITRLLTLPVDFLTESLFFEKRLQGQFGVQGVKNTVIASLFSSNRKAVSTTGAVGSSVGDFGANRDIKQTGGSVAWNSRFSPTLAANATLGVTRNSFVATGRSDRLTTIRLGLTKEIHPKVTGSLSVARLSNDSNAASTSYDENSISATLNMRF